MFLRAAEPPPPATLAVANEAPLGGLRAVPPNAGFSAALETIGGGLHAVPAGATRAVHRVENYTPVSIARVATDPLTLQTTTGTLTLNAGAPLTVLRTFTLDGVASALVVDGEGLRSGVVAVSDLDAASRLATAGEESRYTRSLRAQAGATLSSFSTTDTEATLTVDMCQSVNPWEKALFVSLVEESKRRGTPTEVGIAMTGLWARAHPTELAQLLKWQDEGALAITWINHSDKHQVGAREDFLTNPSIDFTASVVDLEKTLLQNGAVPSVLFRFPGLTHDATRRAELQALGLFGLDADAWLGKGQRPTEGSVILIHGNGNAKRDIPLYSQWRSGAGSTYELVSPLTVVP